MPGTFIFPTICGMSFDTEDDEDAANSRLVIEFLYEIIDSAMISANWNSCCK
jgi:hypothetical protein